MLLRNRLKTSHGAPGEQSSSIIIIYHHHHLSSIISCYHHHTKIIYNTMVSTTAIFNLLWRICIIQVPSVNTIHHIHSPIYLIYLFIYLFIYLSISSIYPYLGGHFGPSLVNGSRGNCSEPHAITTISIISIYLSSGRIISFSPSIQRPNILAPTVKFENGVTTTIGPVEYRFKGR